MKKLIILLLIIVGCCVSLDSVYADEKAGKDLSREKKWYRNYTGEGSTSVSSFCMEGHVFVMVSGDNAQALSIIQVYEEGGGKVVPKRCN